MIKDYFTLAFKNLKHRGIRSWLTLLGILIGVAAVVSLVSLGDGLKMAVSSQFGISSTEVLTVQAGGLNSYGPPGSGVSVPLTEKDLEEIEKLSSVKIAIRRNILNIKIEFNKIQIIGYGINMADGEKRKFTEENLKLFPIEGRLLKDGETGKVFLGNNYIEDKMGFKKEVHAGDKISINGEKFEVVGISEKKGSFIFDNVVYLNEVDAKRIGNYGDKVDVIAIQAISKDSIDKTKEDIEKLLRKRRDVKIGEEDFEVQTPQAMLGTVNSILTGVQIFVAIIAMISIFVGGIGIINTMTTSVLERRKEIGIMKAIGARNSDIFLQFFIEAGLLGLMGGIVGALIGTGVGFIGIKAINNFIGSQISITLNFYFYFLY